MRRPIASSLRWLAGTLAALWLAGCTLFYDNEFDPGSPDTPAEDVPVDSPTDDGDAPADNPDAPGDAQDGAFDSADSASDADGDPDGVGPNELLVSADITVDTTWSPDTLVTLAGPVVVRNGATLTILAGTTVLGTPGSSLVVARDGLIVADGEAARPIVLTSAQPVEGRRRGDWVGLVLLGSVPSRLPSGFVAVPGIDDGDSRLSYGGDVPSSDCGTLRYVRIEFAGRGAAEGPLSALTLAGCGTDTTLDYVHVHQSDHHGVAIWASTADLRHAVITRSDRRALAFSDWRGRAQFVVAQGGRDGLIGDELAPDLASTPVIANATLVGLNAAGGLGTGIVVQNGSAGQIVNTIVVGFPHEAVDIRGTATVDALTADELAFDGLIVHEIGADGVTYFAAEPADSEADDDGGFDEAGHFSGLTGIAFGDPELDDPYQLIEPVLVPRSGGLAEDESLVVTLPDDGFFDSAARYVGAFEPGGLDWLVGWSDFAADDDAPTNAKTLDCGDENCEFACDTEYLDCDADLSAGASGGSNGCETLEGLPACGSSCTDCVALSVPDASPDRCVAGACVLFCDGGFLDCNGDLASLDAGNGCETLESQTACGLECFDCEQFATANPGLNLSTLGCVTGTCRYACAPGFADENGDLDGFDPRAAAGDFDGCEIEESSNCCGAACDTCGLCERCVDGACGFQERGEDLRNECVSGLCTTGACDGDGRCELLPADTECRATGGDCDVAELCDGIDPQCPGDAFEPDITECRPANGICDVANLCTGTGPDCPLDAVATGTVECRASDGDCDVADFCDGVGKTCPTNLFEPDTTECRSANGDCDVAELCTGTGPNCPADSVAQNTVECRGSTEFCDPAERCNGVSKTCPADAFEPEDTPCGGSTVAGCGTCGGFSSSCDESGTQTCTCHDDLCRSGVCTDVASSCNRSCTRDTDGDFCDIEICPGPEPGFREICCLAGACIDRCSPCIIE